MLAPAEITAGFSGARVSAALMRAARNAPHRRVWIEETADRCDILPDTFASFWSHRVWRGTMFPPNFFYFRGASLPRITLRELAKLGRTLLVNLLVLPRLWLAAAYAQQAGGWRALPGQAWAAAVDDVAQTLGTWRALRELVRVEGWRAVPPPPRV